MLIAAGRLIGEAVPAGERAVVALGVSLLLHVGVLLALLLRAGPQMPQGQPPIEVELVQQEAQVRGAAAAAPEAPAPSVPESPAGGVRVPPLPPPPLPRPAPPQPEINLGTGPQDQDALNVISKDVVPPAPDSRFRNLPPRYPAEAARIKAEGIVQLMIHVSPDGLPSEVVVAHTSGFESLDREAKRAVLLWRFRPALNGGQAVPYDYLLNIRFSVGDSR